MKHWVRPLVNSRLLGTLLVGETAVTRFWFSLCSLGCAIAIMFDPNYAVSHPGTMQLASVNAQGLLFMLHFAAMFYGVITRRYSTVLLLLEGVLGVFIWFGFGLAEALHRGTPGPLVIGGILAFFLLLRYPTHYEVVNEP